MPTGIAVAASDGRIGRVVQNGHGCTIVDLSQAAGLRPTV